MSASRERMATARRREKVAVLEAMAQCLCPDCGTQLTVENIAEYRTSPCCMDCSYQRRALRVHRARKIVPFPGTPPHLEAVTSAHQQRTSAVTSAPSTYKSEFIKTPLKVLSNSQDHETLSESETKAVVAVVTDAMNRAAPIIRLTVPPPIWNGPELEERTKRVVAWWRTRTGTRLRFREAAQAAALSFPLTDLLSALERIWRHAKSNGFEARTLKPLWPDLREAEAAYHKRGATKTGRGGMKSLADVMRRPS